MGIKVMEKDECQILASPQPILFLLRKEAFVVLESIAECWQHQSFHFLSAITQFLKSPLPLLPAILNPPSLRFKFYIQSAVFCSS